MSAAVLREATQHVAGMSSDFGGTRLVAPLASVLKDMPLADFPRSIFVLTDGQVSNTDEVLAMTGVRECATARQRFLIG